MQHDLDFSRPCIFCRSLLSLTVRGAEPLNCINDLVFG